MNIEALRSRKQEIIKLASQYGADNIRVFGSVARGEAGESSDIDLLIDIEKGKSLMDFARLKLRLEDLLGYDIDLVEFKSLKPRFKEFIEKDVIPL